MWKWCEQEFSFPIFLTFLQTRQVDELTFQELTYKPSRPCAIILFHVLSILFKEWIKDALTQLSFQKRETIRSLSLVRHQTGWLLSVLLPLLFILQGTAKTKI